MTAAGQWHEIVVTLDGTSSCHAAVIATGHHGVMEKLVWLEAFGRAALQLDSAITRERVAAMGRDAWAGYPEFNPRLVALFELGKYLDMRPSVADMKSGNSAVMAGAQTLRQGS